MLPLYGGSVQDAHVTQARRSTVLKACYLCASVGYSRKKCSKNSQQCTKTLKKARYGILMNIGQVIRYAAWPRSSGRERALERTRKIHEERTAMLVVRARSCAAYQCVAGAAVEASAVQFFVKHIVDTQT